MRRIRPEVCALSLALVIAFVLRVIGIGFGLPLLDHPDEPTLVSRADTMARTNDFNPHFFHYPSFFIYVVDLLTIQKEIHEGIFAVMGGCVFIVTLATSNGHHFNISGHVDCSKLSHCFCSYSPLPVSL